MLFRSDYFNIDIGNATEVPNAQSIIDGCQVQGITALCANIIRVGGAINTVILITSSLLALFSIQELRAGNPSKATRFLGATILLGVVFLGIKATEYRSKFEHGLLPGKIGECVGGLSPENEKLLLPNGVAYVRKVQEKLRAITQEADEVFRVGERVRLLSGQGVTRVSH
mgnify:CR=1 FL=1